MTPAYKKSRDSAADKYIEKETEGCFIGDVFISDTSPEEMITVHRGRFADGYDTGYQAALNSEEVSALVTAVSNALDYYQSTSYCSLNCDPLVNYHEPECCIEVSLRQTLAAFQKARDAQKAEGEK